MKIKLITLSILAAAGNTVAETTTTDTLIVTATRTEQASFTSLASVTVIDRDTIEQSQAQDVADLIRMEAGIDIARNGGPGQSTSFFMRGTESNHAVVMIDGVKINPGTIGQSAIQNIDPYLIERIEIVKGPRSTLYGSDAIGGVINIITRRDERMQISGTTGSFNTRKLNASLGGAANDVYYGIDLGLNRTDGFQTRTTWPNDRGYDNDSVNLKLGTEQEWGSLELRHLQATGNAEYIATDLTTFMNILGDQDFDNRVSAISGEFFVNDYWTSTLTFSNMQDEIEQNQSTDFLETDRNSLDWQNDIAFEQHLFTVGISLQREKADAISYGTAYSADTDTDEVYIQDDIDLGRHKLLIGARHTDHETFGTENTWNIGYGYEVSAATFLFANAGTGFRAPDATDRFGFGGNPNLEPETSTSYELGLRHKFNDALNLTASLFDNRIEDLIDYPGPTFTARNVNEARIKGLEASLNHQQGPWHSSVSLNVQNPKDESNNTQLLRRAKRSLAARTSYQWDKLRLGGELIAQNERHDIDASTFLPTTNAGYGILNLTAEYALSPELDLAARVDNVTDREYVLANGYQTQELSGFITLRYTPGGR